ncbi:hypothetical protein RB598_005627 [Gaeumannomyces tritici]
MVTGALRGWFGASTEAPFGQGSSSAVATASPSGANSSSASPSPRPSSVSNSGARPSAAAADSHSINRYRASPNNDGRPPPSRSLSPSLHQSTPSASPSPQPATPRSPVANADHPHHHHKAEATKPIDITSQSPSFALSSLRESLPSASVPFGHNRSLDDDQDVILLDADLFAHPPAEMTAGAVDSAMGRSRQDSFVSAGPKPISMANPNRAADNRPRRESFGGSLMGGMSWGGLSVSSFIRDEIQMTGTSPYPAHQSPSLHSSSYIPKLEANFMRDFTCCDRTWPTMHDLLTHYEESHTGVAAPARNGSQLSAGQHSLKASSARGVSSASAFGAAQQASRLGQPPTQLGQQSRTASGLAASTAPGGGMNLGGIQQMMRQQQQQQQQQQQPQQRQAHQQGVQPIPSKLMLQLDDHLDAMGDMEMDDPVGIMDMDDSSSSNQRSTTSMQQARQMFGQQQRPQLQLNGSPGLAHQGLRTPQPTTPSAANFGFQDPTVSSVNTPTLTTHQGVASRSQFGQSGAFPSAEDMDEDIPGMPMQMNLGNMNLNGGQFGLGFDAANLNCIQDPGKRLYSPNGGNSQQAQAQAQQAQQQQQQLAQQRLLQQQLAAFNIEQLPPGTDAQALLQHMREMMMPEENKPYKCPVIGCEKAYKNQNGLKYHKTHGHATQQLHENGDGTFSIVNPETSAPYPGTMGMEKEKPFKCEVCGKRYKNLNGLKYHKAHSPLCDPELKLQHQNALAVAAAAASLNPNQLAALSLGLHNLPNIGEESML